MCFVAPYSFELFERDYDQNSALVDQDIPISSSGDASGVGRVGRHLFEPAEALFVGGESLPLMVSSSLAMCPEALRHRIKFMVLDGKTTLLPGLADRLAFELNRSPKCLMSGPYLNLILALFPVLSLIKDSHTACMALVMSRKAHFRTMHSSKQAI